MYWQFANEAQQARAMQALLSRAGGVFTDWGGVFADEKPTDSFWTLLDNQGALSHGERILANVALDIWNGRGEVKLCELFDLDQDKRALVLSLLGAMSAGDKAVDEWIATDGRR